MNPLDNTDIPIGFSMALAQNLDALNHFAKLDKDTQNNVIEQTHHIHSKEEMRNFTSHLGSSNSYF